MIKVFNQGKLGSPGRTFLLTDPDKNQIYIPPKATANVPDSFAGDITFKKAVEAGELVIWQEAKQVDALLKQGEAAEKEAEADPKPAKGGKSGKKGDAAPEETGE